MEEKIITLRTPVSAGSNEVSSITLREPKIGEYSASTKIVGSDTDQSISLIARISGQPAAVIAAMGMRDFLEAAAYLRGFTQDSPETGAT